jgi:hypothetical protein
MKVYTINLLVFAIGFIYAHEDEHTYEENGKDYKNQIIKLSCPNLICPTFTCPTFTCPVQMELQPIINCINSCSINIGPNSTNTITCTTTSTDTNICNSIVPNTLSALNLLA